MLNVLFVGLLFLVSCAPKKVIKAPDYVSKEEYSETIESQNKALRDMSTRIKHLNNKMKDWEDKYPNK